MIFSVLILVIAAGLQTGCTSCGSKNSDRIVLTDTEPAARPALDPIPSVLCRPILASVQLLPVPPIGQHRVTLTWNASVPGPHPAPGAIVSGYCIYRRESTGAPYALLNTAPVNATSCIDARVVNGHTYSYAVTAIGAQATQSAFSAPINASIPSTPAAPPLSQPPLTCWNGSAP